MKSRLPITHRTWQRLVFAVAALVATSAVALGGTITIVPSYVQSFDAAFNPLGTLPGDGAGTPVGAYLQYEFRMTLDDLAPGEDFWTAILNVQLGPGLKRFRVARSRNCPTQRLLFAVPVTGNL